MSEADKINRTFFPKSVPPDASRCMISYSFALVTRCFRAQISPRHCARGRGQVLLLLCKCLFTLRLCSRLRCRAGPSEYQGLMNALKRKMDEGTSETQDSIAQMKKEFADTQKETQKEMQALKQELQGQLAEIMQLLRSRPSA